MKRLFVVVTVVTCFLALIPAPTSAAAWKPPAFIGIGLPSTSGSGYIAGVAMHSVLSKVTGVKFPVTVGDKPAGRFASLRTGRVEFVWSPAGEVLSLLTGTDDFAGMPPQSIRTIWDGGGLDQGLATQANSGIKKVEDLKGRRVPGFDAYPTLNTNVAGALAYGNLTYKDVKAIQLAGFAEGQDALIQGHVDVGVMSALSAQAQEMYASASGLYWIPLPNVTAEDKAAWARFRKVAPLYYPNTTKFAAGVKDTPVDIWAYNYQVICWDTTSEDLVYWMVKQMTEDYDAYKSGNPFLQKWTFDHALQPQMWFSPRHPGAIKYIKEKGRWTPEMEQTQQKLLSLYPQTKTQKKGN